jgi:hypothetical protein
MPRRNKTWADLHIHSKSSDDGELSVEQIVRLAAQNRRAPVKLLAITDHEEIDVEGLEAGMRAAEKHHIQLMTGLEVSTDDKFYDFDKVHILGYFPRCKPEDLKSGTMNDTIEAMKEDKKVRNDKYLRIFRSYNLLTEQEVLDTDFGRSKATLVEQLYDIWRKKKFIEFECEGRNERHYIRDIEQVWNLVEDKRFRQQREKVSTQTMIYQICKLMGGEAAFAHPLLTIFRNSRESVLEQALQECRSCSKLEFKALNNLILMIEKYREAEHNIGLEIEYPYTKTRIYRSLIKKKPVVRKVLRDLKRCLKDYCIQQNICMTGGSDYHGKMKPNISIGEKKIPYDDAARMFRLT